MSSITESDDMLLLPPMGAHAGVVNIRPLVPFSILDHHIRRDASQDRVIGALPAPPAVLLCVGRC